jgi:hypothetical protein
MTKREKYAMAAMQGMLAGFSPESAGNIVKWAFETADLMIEEGRVTKERKRNTAAARGDT